jgi:hypothetical protein
VARTIFALFDDALAALGVAGAFEREGQDRGSISLIVPDPRGRYAESGRGGDRLRVFEPLSAPGLGPAAVTGPLAPVIVDETAARGGLVEALAALGFVGPAARHFFESLRRGQAVIAVETPEDRAPAAVERMRRLRARAVEDIEIGAAPPAVPPPVPTPPRAVHVRSDLVEEPVERPVSLREERVRAERRQVYRDPTPEELAGFREGTLEFYETVEEPVVSKRSRVIEEIVVNRELRERTERVSGTVRKTHVSIEDSGVTA